MDRETLQKLREKWQQAPAGQQPDDLWARLCCEQALLALEQGSYGVGALLVNAGNERVAMAGNRVFADGYHSAAHAEMQLIDLLETEFAHLDRRELTLYVSLEPCLMCSGRILLSGIGRVRYLAADKAGGFASHLHSAFRSPLPAAWQNLASGVSIKAARVQPFWQAFARSCVDSAAADMRRKVLAAWAGDAGGTEKEAKEKGDT